MGMRTATVAALLLQMLLASGLAFGQNIASSIVGRVVDPSSTAVPGAQVTITSLETGAIRKATTDASGAYSVPGLLAGTYDVTVEKQGFAAYHATAVQLLSAETKRVDATLTIGSVEQTVTVSTQAPLLTTDSMTIGASVSQEQLNNLPTGLQTVDTFIALAPGVQSLSQGDATNPPIGGGTHWGSVNFTLNGVGVNDPGNSGAVTVQGVGMLVLPPPSSIQELQVQASGMDAKYRAHSSVTLVTKAGSDAFHFLAYEHLQNTALNANDFVRNAEGLPKPPSDLSQFGGNFGGPIARHKAFFFFDYTGYRNRTSRTVQLNFPSMKMREGDFSELGTQLYNPFTGLAFVNNQIPAGMITEQARTLLKYLPAPTVADSRGLPNASSNYFGTVPVRQDVNSEDLRIDYNLSSRDQLFAVYSQRIAVPWNTSAAYPADYGHGRNAYRNYTVSGTETHVFNATTINELRLAWGDYGTKFSGQNLDFNPQSLFPQMPDTLYRGLPTMTMSGYSGMFHDFGTGLYTPRYDVEITDNFTHIRGRHTIQAGLDETGYKLNSRVPSTGSATGSFSFSGKWTGNRGWPGRPQSNGNAFADFLIGTADSSSTAPVGRFADDIYSRDWGAYVQDTWQIKPRLTLVYGLRYEYQSPWRYPTNEVTTFDAVRDRLVLPQNSATPTLPADADPALFYAYPYETTQSIGLPLHYIQPDRNNFAPRVGFALRPWTDTVIRGGYGIYYNFQPAFVGSRMDGWNPPWQLSISQSFASDLPGKPTSPFLPDVTFANPFPSLNGTDVVSPHPLIRFLQWDFQNELMHEWNLTFERSFLNRWLARASYVGDHAVDVPWNGQPFNVPENQQPNVPTQNQQPYQPFGDINATRSGGVQNFHQVQLGIQRRFAGGFSVDANYQYTRSKDDVPISGGPQIPTKPMRDYGNSNLIRRHWLVINSIYQLPFGHGRRWLAGSNTLADAIVGGWQLSGIGTYGSGLPFNVTFSQAGTGIIGWWGNRADRVPGAPLYAGQQSNSHDITNGVQWFNPAAFAPPQPWQWGNSARNLLFGPGYWNWDMNAAKSFTLPRKMRLQFRADFLDAFNHFNLGDPNANIADTRDGGTPNKNAGKIQGGSGSRRIQLGATLRF
jgi:carboxypeptidase family protein